MVRIRARRVIAAAVTGVFAISVSTAVGSTAATIDTAPAKGTPIVIFQAAPIDSPTLSVPGYRTGAAVAAAAINANGGIGGHPLQVFFCDDKNLASLAAQCFAQAQAAKAVARVGSLTLTDTTYYPLMQNAQMADFGSIANTPISTTAPNSFPAPAGIYTYNAYGPLAKAKYPSAKTAVILIADIAGIQPRIDQMTAGLKSSGITLLDVIKFPPTVADMTSVAGQVQRANPDVVISASAAPILVKYWSASQSLGMSIPIISGPTGITPDVLAQAGAASAWTNFVDYYPSIYSTSPGAAEFRAQMGKYAKGQVLNRDAWVAWVATTAFAAVLQNIKGPITPATVWGSISRVKCFNVLYFRCLNFSKPGPIPAAPSIRVTTNFLLVGKGGQLVGTKYQADAAA